MVLKLVSKVELIVIAKKDTLNVLLMENVYQLLKRKLSALLYTKVDVLVPRHLNVQTVGVERMLLNVQLTVNVHQDI
jgi:hypothetical protein